MPRLLPVSFGKSDDLARITSVKTLHWREIVAAFSKRPPVAASKDARGWYCGAEFSAPHRHGDYFVARHLLTFDFDKITPQDVERIKDAVPGMAYVLYTTYSHTPEAPRLRLLLPLSRSVSSDEFQAVSRSVADGIGVHGIELAARESHVPCQMMFAPAVKSEEAEWWCAGDAHPDSRWVDVDAELATYEDWTDRSSWPRRREHDEVSGADVAEDPRTKPGMIGLFCRTFDIEAAIERFQLPYTRTNNPNRWTYAQGSRAEGVVLYDGGLKAHSHHDSDPAHGQHNAFDLVRLHKFGGLDNPLELMKPLVERASHRAMLDLAHSDPVIAQLELAEEFEPVPEPTPEEAAATQAAIQAAKPDRIEVKIGGTQVLRTALRPTQDAILQCAEEIEVLLYGNRLARPVLTQARRGFARQPVESIELAPYNATGLMAAMARKIDFIRKTQKEDGTWMAQRYDCPPQLAQAVLAEADRLKDIAVDHMTMTPILTGTELHARRGHDRGLRAWILAPEGVAIPAEPTREAAQAALKRLESWLGEFPFETALDKSAALAAMLTAAMRASLDTAPGILVSKPDYGSGASTLCDLIHVILSGRPASVVNASMGRQETDKAIDAVQIAGLPSVVVDNVADGEQFHSIAIAQLLSQPTRQVRILGESTVISAPCTQMVLVNGNNIRVADDLVRRFIRIRLDPHMESPHTREFVRPDLIREAQHERAALLSDLYTLVAAYRRHGERPALSRLAGFTGWLDAVAAPLVWLGLDDPAKTQLRISTDDDKRILLRALLSSWYTAFGQAHITTKECLGDTFGDEDTQLPPEQEKARQDVKAMLAAACPSPRGGVDSTKVGRWLLGVSGRVLNDLSLEQGAHGHGGVRRWYVKNQRDRPEWLE